MPTPRIPLMDSFADRILEVVRNIQARHPKIKSDIDLAAFLNKYQYTTAVVISKWRGKALYPTIQHALLLNKYFKEYGATGNYLIEGTKVEEVSLSELERRVKLLEKKKNHKIFTSAS